MRISDVIMLGAGASHSEDAPLQKDLFKEFFELCSTSLKQEVSEGSLHEMYEQIRNLFWEVWGINISDHRGSREFPTFEEVLGVLDLAYLRGETLKCLSREEIQNVRGSLTFLLGKVLDEKLIGRVSWHKKLVARLVDERKIRPTAFVSFNYDIVIDNAVTELYPTFDLDYGIDFINFFRRGDWKRPRKQKSVLLLKMHGSLNWLYCPTCIHVELTPKEKGAMKAFYNAKKCDDCSTSMTHVIVPPTYYKDLSNIYIREIFLRTEKILRDAKRIYFCGYSFPDADLHIKYLLKRAEVHRGRTPDIYVINNYEGKSTQSKEEEIERYKRFFREHGKINYTEMSFRDFCDHGV